MYSSVRNRIAAISALTIFTLALVGCGETPVSNTPTLPAGETPVVSASPTSGGSGGGEVVVFAAASLQDAFKELDAQMPETATYNFAGSQVLVTQLREGAQADVLATADKESMDAAIAAGVVESGSEQVLATNRLVVATAPGSSAVKTLQDLAKPGVKLVLAEESVPAGRYALQILDKLAADPAFGSDFKDKVLANVVSKESNVRQTLAKVTLGEADAGIVYTTDAKAASEAGTIDIPEGTNVVARYYVAPLKSPQHSQTALNFIEHALSKDGQQTLVKFGFGPAEVNQ